MSEKNEKKLFTLYNPDYHEAVRETSIRATDVSDGLNKMSDLYKLIEKQENSQVHVDKLLEHIATEFERMFVEHRPVPQVKGEMMILFYKAWSMGMARYADELGVTLV